MSKFITKVIERIKPTPDASRHRDALYIGVKPSSFGGGVDVIDYGYGGTSGRFEAGFSLDPAFVGGIYRISEEDRPEDFFRVVSLDPVTNAITVEYHDDTDERVIFIRGKHHLTTNLFNGLQDNSGVENPDSASIQHLTELQEVIAERTGYGIYNTPAGHRAIEQKARLLNCLFYMIATVPHPNTGRPVHTSGKFTYEGAKFKEERDAVLKALNTPDDPLYFDPNMSDEELIHIHLKDTRGRRKRALDERTATAIGIGFGRNPARPVFTPKDVEMTYRIVAPENINGATGEIEVRVLGGFKGLRYDPDTVCLVGTPLSEDFPKPVTSRLVIVQAARVGGFDGIDIPASTTYSITIEDAPNG